MSKLLMKAELFAIRHSPTQLYMPQRIRPGYTLLEVEDFTTTPRLFWSRSGASKSLTAWLKGVHERSSSYQDPMTGEWDYDPGGYPEGPPPSNRVAGEMEIVEFTSVEKADDRDEVSNE